MTLTKQYIHPLKRYNKKKINGPSEHNLNMEKKYMKKKRKANEKDGGTRPQHSEMNRPALRMAWALPRTMAREIR